MYTGLHVKYPPFLSAFNFNFLDILFKNNRISNFMKIRSVGAELFNADRRTDRHEKKLTIAFHNYANAQLHYTAY